MSSSGAVDGFVLEHIDSVPHLEALLQLWNTRPRHWSAEEMGATLFLTTEATEAVLNDLVRKQIISAVSETGTFWYEQETSRDELLRALENAYRTELIRLTRIIHSKPSAAVRAFARAFRLKKDRN